MGSNRSQQLKEEDQNLTAPEKDEALTIGVQETWKEFTENPCQLGLIACPCNESERQQPMCVVKISHKTVHQDHKRLLFFLCQA